MNNKTYLHVYSNLKIMALFILIILPFYALWAGTTDTSIPFTSIEPIGQACGEMNISVDPRIELLTTIQYLSGSRYVMKDKMGYADSINTWFASYKSHPVIEHYRQLEKKGFSFDLPPTWFMLFESVPLLNKIYSVQAYEENSMKARMEYVGKPVDIDLFISEVNDFAIQSRFDMFFAGKTAFYQAQLVKADSLIRETNTVDSMIDWYGYRFNSYSFIVSPLQGYSGYGPTLVNSEGGIDLYCITALQGSASDKYAKYEMAYLLYHEFSHSYLNLLIDIYYSQLYKAKRLFRPIKHRMTEQAYGNWWITLDEHYVRASTQRLLQNNALTRDLVLNNDNETSQGFIYIDYIYNGLLRYEAERKKSGITYKEYFPVLVQDLILLSKNPKQYIKDKMLFKGPINIVGNSSAVVIIPDPETNPGVKESIVPTVNAIYKSNGTPVITDTQALKRKFKHINIYVYGTIDSNKWLQKYKELLPFQIYPDRIIADKEYMGTDLRIISCLPNPDNHDYGMAVYTAQTMEAMKRSNNIFHGPEDFVISNSAYKILGNGYYDKSGAMWQFKENK